MTATLDQEMVEELRALGATDEQLDALSVSAEPQGFGIWPENAEIVRVFLSVGTQWRWATGGGAMASVPIRTGLDYAGVKAAIELQGIRPDRDLFWGLQIMERAALEELNR